MICYLLAFIAGVVIGASIMALLNLAGREERLQEDRAFRIAMRRLKNQKGSVVIVVTLFLIPILALASLVIEASMMGIVRNQLQNAVDSSVLAAASNLGNQFSTIEDCETRKNLIPDLSQVVAVGQEMLAKNKQIGTVTISGNTVVAEASADTFSLIFGNGGHHIVARAMASIFPPGGEIPCREADGSEPQFLGAAWHMARLTK